MFSSTRKGAGLFWKAADGTGQVEQLKEGAGLPYAWSADGRLLFEQGGNIGALTMDGERSVEMLLDADVGQPAPALSPDGRWLAYASEETGTPLIYVKPFPNIDDGQWRVSPDPGDDPVWSPDGRELYYRGEFGTGLMVAQIETEPTFSRRTPEPLFSLSSYGVVDGRRQFDLAPAGDRFIFRKRGAAVQTSDDDRFNGLIFVQNWFEALCAKGLGLAAQLLGTRVPGRTLERLSEPQPGEVDVSAKFVGGDLTRIDVLVDDLRHLRRWRDRLRLVWEHVFPSPSYMLESYALSNHAFLPALYAHRLVAGAWKWLRRID